MSLRMRNERRNKKSRERSRGYIIVINNYDEKDEEHCRRCEDLVSYAIFGKEVGEQGTPHIQGYIHFKNARAFKPVQRMFPTAHVEPQYLWSTVADNIKYCSKENLWLEFGERPADPKDKGQAERDRWALAREAAVTGRLEEIPDDIFIRHYGSLRSIAKDYMPRAENLEGEEGMKVGVWIWGQAGVGKSRYARKEYPDAYLKNKNKWWDGYRFEETVIIDDWDPNHACLRSHLKEWSDRYAFIAEIKGGGMSIRPKTVVVTSQYPIESCFPDLESQEAFKRRFHVIHMNSPMM